MKRKEIAIVTGAYGKIGKAISETIAVSKRYRVILAGRNKARLEETVAEIKDVTQTNDIDYVVVDVSVKSSIVDLYRRWNSPIQVIVNNAAVTPQKRLETSEGVEMQFATNVLGYFWMIKYMSKFMKDVDNARIINVASYWAGGLDLADIEYKKRKYTNNNAYKQSKQADRMISSAFAEILAPDHISVAACHPGDVNSVLSNNLGFGGNESPFEGAITPAWLAISKRIPNINGKYFERLQEVRCKFSENKSKVWELYNYCESY
jgi:retinol dehydrogenase 12